MKNNKNGAGRAIIVSYFESYPYDPEECNWHGDEKCYGEISINTKENTITFKYVGGTAPILYVMLLVMSANKHWDKIVRENYRTVKRVLKNYSLISRWNDYASTEIFLAHEGENGLPVIDKRSVHIDDIGRGIHQCTLTPLEFILFYNEYKRGLSYGNNYKDRLKEARKDYEFRYITDEKAKAHAAPIVETEDEDDFGFSIEDDEDFNFSDAEFGFEEFDDDIYDLDLSDALYFEE